MVLSLNQFFGKINKKIRGLLNEAVLLRKLEKKIIFENASLKKCLDKRVTGQCGIGLFMGEVLI